MRRFPRHCREAAFAPGRRGFTLIELLAATSVLTLLVFFLVAMTNQASNIVTQEQARKQHCQRARAALEFIARDLRSAALPVVTDQTRPTLQLIINPPSLAGIDVDGANRDSIFWQAPIATDTSQGNLAEVGYFVRWNGVQANLCRFFVNPSETTPVAPSGLPNYRIYPGATAAPGGAPAPWLDKDLLKNVAPADNQPSAADPAKRNNYRGLFLENVVGLWVQGRLVVNNVDTDFAAAPYNNDSRANASHAADQLPAYVELALALLDSGSAARVTTTDVTTIRNLYASSAPAGVAVRPADLAAAFTQALPAKLRPGASVVNLRVSLDNSRTPR